VNSQSYDDWPIRQLQDECRSRGLQSGRAKAELVQRLLDSDMATEDGLVVAESDVPAAPEPAPVVPVEPEPAVSGSGTFRSTFPHVPGGVDDATHLAYRRRTYEEAVAAGHAPRGGELGAHRVGTTTDGEVYEINVRPRGSS
jgi:hypothetical protein